MTFGRRLLGATDPGFVVNHLVTVMELEGSGAMTVNMPNEQRAGDLVVWAAYGYSATEPTPSVPSGFTSISSASADLGDRGHAVVIGYKMTTEDEGGDALAGFTIGGAGYVAVSVFRPSREATVTATSGGAQVVSPSITDQALALGDTPKPAVAVAMYGAYNVTTFLPNFRLDGVTPAGLQTDSQSSGFLRGRFSAIAANTPTDTYDVTLTASGGTRELAMASAWFELTEV